MKIDLDKLSYEPKWYHAETMEVIEEKDKDPDEPYLYIRPFPFSRSALTIDQDGQMSITGDAQWKAFNHSLIDWSGILGSDQKPLPCTEEVKRKIYDFRVGDLPNKVAGLIWNIESEKAVTAKN